MPGPEAIQEFAREESIERALGVHDALHDAPDGFRAFRRGQCVEPLVAGPDHRQILKSAMKNDTMAVLP
jgi:hypothetical protein